jgi:hypothetical protein
MKTKGLLLCLILLISELLASQTLTETQMRNARATGYAIIAARNPGKSFSIFMIPWDGVSTLEYNANAQINPGWHPQAVVKGNYFTQPFDGNDFSMYSTVILSQAEFDQYKNVGTQWWIVCSTLPSFSCSIATSNDGNVGIGTTIPDQKLTVKGKIHAEEVIVDLNVPVADYVFKPNYKLMPLPEVEQFVKANSHLPEIPSATEISKNGLSMGEMQNKLLQKVEELTLYVIELKKEIETMKKQPVNQ